MNAYIDTISVKTDFILFYFLFLLTLRVRQPMLGASIVLGVEFSVLPLERCYCYARYEGKTEYCSTTISL